MFFSLTRQNGSLLYQLVSGGMKSNWELEKNVAADDWKSAISGCGKEPNVCNENNVKRQILPSAAF